MSLDTASPEGESRRPQRKHSSASSASSGRTIKPSSRQASGANGGFFGRFRNTSQPRSYSDGEDDDDDDEDDDRTEPKAGPSDYYRRSPSPPSPPHGWRTASSDVNGEVGEMDGPRDEWKSADVWADSDLPTPDNGDGAEGDVSVGLDSVEYEKRIREVLNGIHRPEPETVDEDLGNEEGIGVESMLEKTGIGEEEFGVQSPRSSAPSTPSLAPRQLSYIRESISG